MPRPGIRLPAKLAHTGFPASPIRYQLKFACRDDDTGTQFWRVRTARGSVDRRTVLYLAAHTRIKPFSRPYLGKKGSGQFPDTLSAVSVSCTVILDTYSAGSVGMYVVTYRHHCRAESMEGGRGQRIKIGVSIIAYSNAWYQDTGHHGIQQALH